jgi:hypothetical protein
MENKADYFEDLKIIKKVMEESSRFLSLSGLSGVFAGLAALTGTAIAVWGFMHGRIILSAGYLDALSPHDISLLKIRLATDALIVLALAIGISLYFSYRKSVKNGTRIWTPVSRRLLTSLLVPLVAGGIFIIIVYIQNQWQLIIPAMLMFYGLSLVNAGKFTYNEVFYLGIIEIIVGLIAAVVPEYGIFLWALGFGLLHVIYGLIMFRKYER